jgi:apolipoprotein D and lipocalin family protein
MRYYVALIALFLTGCLGTPPNVTPQQNFDISHYLGKWYEIARLEHRFERGMEQITATYSLRKDGGVKVVNKGYKTKEKKWNEAHGKAYFVQDSNRGFLKVSFFGPFYGSYIVMDTDYKTYTMISGPNHSYFWILSRQPTLESKTLKRLLAKANKAGFDTTKLIYPNQKGDH